MAFLSGSFGPPEDYPALVEAIGDVLPLRYLIDLVRGAYQDDAGVWSNRQALVVLAAWGALGLVIAVRKFRWAPRDG